jgi:hypothetical protein
MNLSHDDGSPWIQSQSALLQYISPFEAESSAEYLEIVKQDSIKYEWKTL